jgi:lycopene cyclase domain-containing protein
VGGGYLVRTWRTWPVAVAVPTLYLWFADRVAIGLGVWTISETFTLGIDLFGLPMEEATFFLVTNLLVVQGLVLFEWVLHRYGRLVLDADAADPESTPLVDDVAADAGTPRNAAAPRRASARDGPPTADRGR